MWYVRTLLRMLLCVGYVIGRNNTEVRGRLTSGLVVARDADLDADFGALIELGINLLDQLSAPVADWCLGDVVEELVGRTVGVQNVGVVVNYCLAG